MINQYKILRTIGKGSFSIVYLVQDTKTMQFYSMKAMKKNELKKKLIGKNGNAYNYVLEELKVL